MVIKVLLIFKNINYEILVINSEENYLMKKMEKFKYLHLRNKKTFNFR